MTTGLGFIAELARASGASASRHRPATAPATAQARQACQWREPHRSSRRAGQSALTCPPATCAHASCSHMQQPSSPAAQRNAEGYARGRCKGRVGVGPTRASYFDAGGTSTNAGCTWKKSLEPRERARCTVRSCRYSCMRRATRLRAWVLGHPSLAGLPRAAQACSLHGAQLPVILRAARRLP